MSLVYIGFDYASFGPNERYSIHRDGCLTKNGKRMSDILDDGGYIQNTALLRYNLDSRRHRMIGHYFVHNPRPDYFLICDHINGIRTDNRPENIRWLTHQLNNLNTKSTKISPRPNRTKPYHAQISFMSNSRHLGWYRTEQEALGIQDRIRQELFDKLYWYETTPRTFVPPPVEWIVNALGVCMFADRPAASPAIVSLDSVVVSVNTVMQNGVPTPTPTPTPKKTYFKEIVFKRKIFPGWEPFRKAITKTHVELPCSYKYKESHYQKALEHYIHKFIPGVTISKEVTISFKTSDGFVFAYGRMDLVVETETEYIILELKANINIHNKLNDVKAQLSRYMIHAETTKKVTGLIVSFGNHAAPFVMYAEINRN